ncbi:hypothetical protein Tco_1112421, partial [Tanacetum coccineum]
YSKSKEDHEVYLKLELELQKEEKLFVKFSNYCDALKSRIGMCVPTKRQGDYVCLVATKDSREELYHAWFGVGSKAWSACVDHLRSWWKIYFAVLVDIAEGIGNTAKNAYNLSSSDGRTKLGNNNDHHFTKNTANNLPLRGGQSIVDPSCDVLSLEALCSWEFFLKILPHACDLGS